MALHSPASAMDDERIARLRAYGVLDPDHALPALDELVKRAQDVAAFPMAWLSFFDGKRERLRARAESPFAYLPREQSFAFGTEPLRRRFSSRISPRPSCRRTRSSPPGRRRASSASCRSWRPTGWSSAR